MSVTAVHLKYRVGLVLWALLCLCMCLLYASKVRPTVCQEKLKKRFILKWLPRPRLLYTGFSSWSLGFVPGWHNMRLEVVEVTLRKVAVQVSWVSQSQSLFRHCFVLIYWHPTCAVAMARQHIITSSVFNTVLLHALCGSVRKQWFFCKQQ